MKKWLQRIWKEEKGLTLIELLAVIVILGIIAAIAVPAITGITSNTKKEAHKANARQMIEAAKQIVAISGFNPDTPNVSVYPVNNDGTLGTAVVEGDDSGNNKEVMEITLNELESAGYFTGIKDPESNNNYSGSSSAVYVYKKNSSDKAYTYAVKLEGNSNTYIKTIEEKDIDKYKVQ
ncbi:prepilin-type N-terminal cleavage/methylation domain-containing protein [Brevibacillus sp. SYP-B805]|uniref:type II secretion system protein n=1 Tax=Brevibacillus sp. SYP-B805 TaxID=1578199 RepID=UPI0013EA5312|nr:prepilin-type N-terminal cleavage/methylation domain-containing protein [Brevibacillus sp. SYP-B805]NGQ94319.1 prepilin-type N-terminal cleavage/methylation domain-containing protein [Brevibacillus sp. SYP-B805]